MATILIIDENDADFQLASQGLREAGARQRLHHARTSAETLDFLQQHRPHLILFDISLRYEEGLELLRQMKKKRKLRATPIIVFTTSDDPGDVQDALQSGANAYVKKPLRLEEFLATMHHIANFWLDVALTAASARMPELKPASR